MKDSGRDSFSSGHIVLTLIVTIVVLRLAQDILVPIALAILLSFALIPLIVTLVQWKFPRSLAIITSMIFAFSLIGLLTWMVSYQVVDLIQDVPKYQGNVQKKLHDLKNLTPNIFAPLTAVTRALKKEEESSLASAKAEQAKPKPVLVEMVSSQQSLIGQISTILSPVLGTLGTILLVIVFVIFILFNREDLGERFIKLISKGNLNLATQAIDDAAKRITKYLQMNIVVNSLFGLSIGLGLFFIGIPNALLGGLLAALLRFIPYIGIWIAASFPLILACSVDPGWSMLFMTIVLFTVVELICNYLIEPRLYGASTGVSSMALLVASVFWTWIWGIVGLFLSVPLTVCIFVLSKYVAELEFLEVILGSEPVFKPDILLYQRMLAMDEEEAFRMSKMFLKETSLCDYYDQLLIPALGYAEEDRHKGNLAEHRHKFILEQTQELIDSLSMNEDTELSQADIELSSDQSNLNTICIPAHDESDELSARMLAQLLNNEGMKSLVIECVAPTDKMNAFLLAHPPKVICISSLPPYALSSARTVCRRIRKLLPKTKIVVGIWGISTSLSQIEERIGDCAASVVVSLKEAISQIKLQSGEDNLETKEPMLDLPHQLELQNWLKNEKFIDLPLSEVCTVIIKAVAKIFNVPTTLVSVMETDRHFWKTHLGLIPDLDESQAHLLETPLCEDVITENKTVIVENVASDYRFAKDTWLQNRGICSFIGTPLKSGTGHAVGILCVLDTRTRTFTEQEQFVIETFADLLMHKINEV